MNVLYIDMIEDNAISLYEWYAHAVSQEPMPQDSWNLQLW